MENKNTSHLDDLKMIRKVMEESSRFLSLSGLSGIVAGLVAIAGAAIAWFVILRSGIPGTGEGISPSGHEMSMLITDGIIVLILAIGASLYFSIRKSGKTGVEFWTPVSKRMVINMSVPLLTGGIFIIGLFVLDFKGLIVPSMLIFYGLSLVNAGKFTFNEVFYLGLLEVCTGLICVFFPDLGIYFWTFGFGILHIIYGAIMYGKYER
jgi:hypothetical protein